MQIKLGMIQVSNKIKFIYILILIPCKLLSQKTDCSIYKKDTINSLFLWENVMEFNKTLCGQNIFDVREYLILYDSNKSITELYSQGVYVTEPGANFGVNIVRCQLYIDEIVNHYYDPTIGVAYGFRYYGQKFKDIRVEMIKYASGVGEIKHGLISAKIVRLFLGEFHISIYNPNYHPQLNDNCTVDVKVPVYLIFKFLEVGESYSR